MTAPGKRIFHHAFPRTGAAKLALASRSQDSSVSSLSLRHPGGLMNVTGSVKHIPNVGKTCRSVGWVSTPRILMTSLVW